VDQFNHWLVPSSHSTGNIPRLDASTLSDLSVRLAQTSWNFKSMEGQFNRWLVPSSDITGNMPWLDASKLSDLNARPTQSSRNSIQPLRLDPKRSFLLLAIDGVLHSQQIKEAASLLPTTQQLKCKTGSNVLKFNLLSLVVLPSSANRPGMDVLPLIPLITHSNFSVGPAQSSWNSTADRYLLVLVVLPQDKDLDWTLLPLIPLITPSDFSVRQVQNSRKSKKVIWSS